MTMNSSKRARRIPKLRAGDLVEVRSAEEILATLDERGELECLPFMPEMLAFCGRRMTVRKVAHKLCEVITGDGGLRWMNDAVHLVDASCSGAAHGGCQTACSLYWKESWLLRIEPGHERSAGQPAHQGADGIDISALERAARKAPDADGNELYSCQATEILRAAPDPIRFFDLGQYVADIRSGNVGFFALVRSLLFHVFNVYQRWSRRRLPSWLLIKEGLSWGFVKGRAEGRTPTAHLDLQVGELVRIRSTEEITQTLDPKRLNRGMGFEEEMARSCGRITRVTARVDRCIEERTGRMLTMKNPCIVLDSVVCAGVYHANCPREYVPFWREIWLERVNSPSNLDQSTGTGEPQDRGVDR